MSKMFSGMNSLTDREYVSVIASLEAVFISDFNCRECVNIRTVAQREYKGCFSNDIPKKYKSNNVRFSTCIGNYSNSVNASYLFETYKSYSNGSMGDTSKMPAKFIELMGVVDAFIDEKKRESDKKNKK